MYILYIHPAIEKIRGTVFSNNAKNAREMISDVSCIISIFNKQ